MNIDNITTVKKLINENKSFSFILKTSKYKEIYADILDYTKTLDIAFKERIYWYINQIKDYPICALDRCNKKSTKFLSIKYGYKKYCCASCAARSDECKQRHINTCKKKYGVSNVAQCKIVRDKMNATMIKRYGVANVGSSKELREKIRKTNLEKYGTANGHKKAESLKIGYNISLARCTNFYNKVLNTDNEVRPLFSIADYMKSDKDGQFMWHCCKCKKDFLGKIRCGKHIARCLNCYPYSESKPEQDVIEFIKTECHLASVKQHDRSLIKPLEIDIYIPEKKIAIEFDGLYWHSDDVLTNKNYHLFKTEECEKQGIQLIHIFENEWMQKQAIVKSRIKNLLGIYNKTVFARKCEVRKLKSGSIVRDFLEENHIQGNVNSSVSLGLYFQDELISLMTFGKTRFSKKYEWELTRFCNKLGYHIPGAAGKLLRYFERNYNPKSLVSYADRRWSQGKLYKALGFKLDHASAPNYWYWNGDYTLESRIKFQKHKLANKLKFFDQSKSESQNMYDNGYHRIFDCGNLVFKKDYEKMFLKF